MFGYKKTGERKNDGVEGSRRGKRERGPKRPVDKKNSRTLREVTPNWSPRGLLRRTKKEHDQGDKKKGE